MPYDLSDENQVEKMFGSTWHPRGAILRARFVGRLPAMVKDGRQHLPSVDVWDFLIRTPRGRFTVVRGEPLHHGQPIGGPTTARSVEDWWTEVRRSKAEATFAKIAKLAEPVGGFRGGGACWGGYYHTAEEFEAAKKSGEVNNK